MDYNTHFESAMYEHKLEKKKSSNRRRKNERHKRKEFRMVKEGQLPTFYIKDEKTIYQSYVVKIPAYYEEEKYLIGVKNGAILCYEADGTPIYVETFRYVKTGRLIYHPARKVKRHKSIGTQPCVPYIKHYSLSGRKSFAKKMTNLKIRRDSRIKIARGKSGYKKVYDYAWYVL